MVMDDFVGQGCHKAVIHRPESRRVSRVTSTMAVSAEVRVSVDVVVETGHLTTSDRLVRTGT